MLWRNICSLFFIALFQFNELYGHLCMHSSLKGPQQHFNHAKVLSLDLKDECFLFTMGLNMFDISILR